jgi:serine/threonine protein kinase
MTLSVDQVINNRYRIVKLLGQGGFGAVYQAYDINLDRICALKENLETTSEVARQFEREARMLANLTHPNLPRVTDHFRIPEKGQYLVMDYIEGEDLEQMIERLRGPLGEEQALEWIDQVCDALSYLHQQNPPIIHRDIKPANIRVTLQGSGESRAVLVDFGIAKFYDPALKTTVGARAVTPGYSPPEQYGRGVTDAQSDIYALAATLYTLLTAEVPPDSVDLMSGNAPPLSPANVINPKISPQVSAAITQAMNPTRERRFRTVRAFKIALHHPVVPKTQPIAPVVAPLVARPEAGLRGDLGGDGVQSRPGTGARPPSAPPPRPDVVIRAPPSQFLLDRRGWTMLIVGALLLGALALVGTFVAARLLANTPKETLPPPFPARTAVQIVETEAPTSTFEPTPTDTPVIIPTDTPEQPPEPGAVKLSLPDARIAFVSDHQGNATDRIYVITVSGGEYWFAPRGGFQYGLANGETRLPFSPPEAVAFDDSSNIAWWPEWCQANRTLFFELQKTSQPEWQGVSYVPFGQSGVSPVPLNWGFDKLGVPRCSHSGSTGLVSALKDYTKNDWSLYRFDIANPNLPQIVGDGFAFAGNASWSADDSWIVFMRRPAGATGFSLVRLDMNSYQAGGLPTPEGYQEAKYPAVSPTSGKIAFACSIGSEWRLCDMNSDGSNERAILSGWGSMNGKRADQMPTIPPLTPSWSPDGRWIALAIQKDGAWDVYLYLVEKDILVNLTQALSGNQFQPSWSKP